MSIFPQVSKYAKNMLFFQNMLFEKSIGFWLSKYANFPKLAYKYAIWQP